MNRLQHDMLKRDVELRHGKWGFTNGVPNGKRKAKGLDPKQVKDSMKKIGTAMNIVKRQFTKEAVPTLENQDDFTKREQAMRRDLDTLKVRIENESKDIERLSAQRRETMGFIEKFNEDVSKLLKVEDVIYRDNVEVSRKPGLLFDKKPPLLDVEKKPSTGFLNELNEAISKMLKVEDVIYRDNVEVSRKPGLLFEKPGKDPFADFKKKKPINSTK